MRKRKLFGTMVREERLRATAGMPGAADLTSWRGRSGRRYVVGTHRLNEADASDLSGAVVLAVSRNADGGAVMVDCVDTGRTITPIRQWLSAMLGKGVTELHVHRLAGRSADRKAIVADLRNGAQASATAIAASVRSLTPSSMSC